MADVTKRTVKGYIKICRNLPEPPEEFYTADLADKMRKSDHWTGHRLKLLREEGITELLNTRERTPKEKGGKWRVKPEAYEIIEEVLERDPDSLLPCGHNGFVNLGDQLECKTCNRRHGRSVVSSDA